MIYIHENIKLIFF